MISNIRSALARCLKVKLYRVAALPATRDQRSDIPVAGADAPRDPPPAERDRGARSPRSEARAGDW